MNQVVYDYGPSLTAATVEVGAIGITSALAISMYTVEKSESMTKEEMMSMNAK